MTTITGTITESEWDGVNGWCTIITTIGKVRLPFFSHELAVAAFRGRPVSVAVGAVSG
jgi:hypothetical protein